MTTKLLLAGCGKMGGALLEGWLQRGIQAGDVTIVEPNEEIRNTLSADHSVNTCSSAQELPQDLAPNVVMLAVKPQMMDDVAPLYSRYRSSDCVFLSIAAGKTIAYFENHLGKDAAIIRSMPNTPAAVRRGITVACSNSHTSQQQRETCDTLLQAVGSVEWVEDEDMIDAVTALSGGGPAYVFLLVECMAQAGIDAGLPNDLAMKLARETVAGSGELLHQASEEAATLRQNVTSPGGTTAEALRVLMADDGWQPLVTKAIAAATARSRELAG
ncbi:MAG: pyrroline-5-carboxylate reductase [Rhodospirillales bacterium]|mgnify:CR=1 FL=1|jgi:pyrroline-5-carboxylate reductase|nr:pyrroline-5-carboxylate reductase [Rhodospirillales bacterium]